VWVIVDDGSIDGTSNIIKEALERYSWIQSIRLPEHSRNLGKHYAYVCNVGFESAIRYCESHKLEFDYIGLVDSDMFFEADFFEKLILEFERNPKLGIASGTIYYDTDGRLIMEEGRDDLPVGSNRLFRKKCFEDIKGYEISYSPDAVANVAAKLKGWELIRFNNLKAIQRRKTSSAEGLWKGYRIHGESAYFRNYHPLFVFGKSLKYLFQSPHYVGIAYLYGYLIAMSKGERINNKEIRDYYYQQKYKEAVEYYKAKLARFIFK
jgi:glycosyltransferase involved in cell wall biosynthesis